MLSQLLKDFRTNADKGIVFDYGIYIIDGDVGVTVHSRPVWHRTFLSFTSKERADTFLDLHKDLILQAAPLL